MKKITILLILSIFLCMSILNARMIEVSVDAIEIKDIKEQTRGIAWNETINFVESLGVSQSAFSIAKISRKDTVTANLRALIRENHAKIIANPKLATESGSQATFLVGGELPVPVVTDRGVGTEWKSYGVNLSIKPKIVSNNRIKATIQVSVSDLDYANSVKIQNYDVPGLLTRNTNSTVEVENNGTIVIAGLKQTKKETTENRVPLLSLIPILGEFFKTKSERDVNNSLIIFVTFKIVSD